MLAPAIAEQLQGTPLRGRGRRIIPGDAALSLVRIVTLQHLAVQAMDGQWLTWSPWTAAVSFRPQVIGVGGVLGIDILPRFRRLAYELGPPDTLLLEETT